MGYRLTGDFVECCDCFTVCPCWVADVPDEDHCSGLYLWSFGEDSRIDGVSVAGMKVAAATYHAVRAKGQVMLFIDTGAVDTASQAERLLLEAFSGRRGGNDLEALVKLMGVHLGYRPATITATFERQSFHLEIQASDQIIAKAAGTNKKFADQSRFMTMKDTALSAEMGIGDGEVVVQTMDQLTVDVAALPGGPLNFRGRSGMRSRFTYRHGDPFSGGMAEEKQPLVAKD